MSEIVAARTPFTKTYDLGGDKRRMVARQTLMHYEDGNGDLQDVDTSIAVDRTVAGAGYIGEVLQEDMGYRLTERGTGKTLTVRLRKAGATSFIKRNLAAFGGNENRQGPSFNANNANFQDPRGMFGLRIEFLPDRARTMRTINGPGQNKVLTWEIEEEVGAVSTMSTKVVGRDAAGARVRYDLTIENDRVEDGVRKYDLIDNWDGTAMARNAETRVLEPVAVTYPVTIDPQTTGTIAANQDDGSGAKLVTGTAPTTFTSLLPSTWSAFLTYSTHTVGFQVWGGYLLFSGITIPQYACVDTATLKAWMVAIGASQQFHFTGVDSANPTTPPSTVTAIVTPPATAGQVTHPVYDTQPYGPPSAANMGLQNVDVKSIVQTLVNSYDYSNEAMMFMVNAIRGIGLQQGAIYNRDQGTTKDAELVIDYHVSFGSKIDNVASTSLAKVNSTVRCAIKTISGVE